jgi:parvulin-like peptidyl-prolyl isomerase
MNRPLASLLRGIALSGFVLTACSPREQPGASPEFVARVGETGITTEVLQQALLRRGWTDPSAEQKARALEELIRFEVLYAQARRDGYDQRPEIRDAIKRLLVARYQEELESKEPPAPKITDEATQTHYQARQDDHRVPEQAKAALIFLPLPSKATPEKRAEAAQHAAELRRSAETECASIANFGALAQAQSAHQASRYRGGELGWLTREQAAQAFGPEVAEAMFALQQPGELSPVVTVAEGFYLLKLVGRQAASVRPLAEVKDALAHQLQRERTAQREAALFARLKSGVPIQINEAALERVKVPTPQGPAPPSNLPSR